MGLLLTVVVSLSLACLVRIATKMKLRLHYGGMHAARQRNVHVLYVYSIVANVISVCYTWLNWFAWRQSIGDMVGCLLSATVLILIEINTTVLINRFCTTSTKRDHFVSKTLDMTKLLLFLSVMLPILSFLLLKK
jgi:hypothetical protein